MVAKRKPTGATNADILLAATAATQAAIAAANAATESAKAASRFETQLVNVNSRLERVEQDRESSEARLLQMEADVSDIKEYNKASAAGIEELLVLNKAKKLGGRLLEWLALVGLTIFAALDYFSHHL